MPPLPSEVGWGRVYVPCPWDLDWPALVPCQTRQSAKETQSKGDVPRVQKVPAAQKSTMCPFVDRSLRTYYVLKLGQTLRCIWGQKQGRPHTEHAAVGG